jgi:hypothetical protein
LYGCKNAPFGLPQALTDNTQPDVFACGLKCNQLPGCIQFETSAVTGPTTLCVLYFVPCDETIPGAPGTYYLFTCL